MEMEFAPYSFPTVVVAERAIGVAAEHPADLVGSPSKVVAFQVEHWGKANSEPQYWCWWLHTFVELMAARLVPDVPTVAALTVGLKLPRSRYSQACFVHAQ